VFLSLTGQSAKSASPRPSPVPTHERISA
jgi:hypothetical protein